MVQSMRTICQSYRTYFGQRQQFVVGLSPVFGGDLTLITPWPGETTGD